MAASALSQDDLKALDSARQRLSTLTNTLKSLLGQIHSNDPLPAWSELTQLSSVISQNLTALSALLSENEPLLSALVAYPVPAFPGRTQEALLEQLLRKKLEPEIEDWAGQGQRLAEAAGDLGEQRALWTWAPAAANEEARRHMFIGNDYTRAEVERGVDGVVTGLRRRLVVPDDESSGDEDDEDDEDAVEDGDADDGMGMVGVRRASEAQGGVQFDLHAKKDEEATDALPVAAQLRFMTTGAMGR